MKLRRTFEDSVTVHNPAKAYDGYTLFAPHYTKDLWLIDMKGRPVEHWEMPSHLGGAARLLPNGNQLRINKTYRETTGCLGTVGGNLAEIDMNGKQVWNYENEHMHHDCIRLDNGNTLVLSHSTVPSDIAARIKGGLPGTEGLPGLGGEEIMGDSILEVTPSGDVVWEWLAYEHMDLDIDVLCPLCPRTAWPYLNGLDVFPNGDIVVSARLLNCLFVIDKQSKAIKKRLGTKELGHQHNPTVLENGNVLVFDNGFHRLPKPGAPFSIESFSRVLEINPDSDTIEWEYRAEAYYDFYSAGGSGCGRLPNGNTLICEMFTGRIFEVTPESEIVWEFINPLYEDHDMFGLTNGVFQAHRYGVDHPAFQGRSLTPERYELVVRDTEQEAGRTDKESVKESAAARRLRMLGY